MKIKMFLLLLLLVNSLYADGGPPIDLYRDNRDIVITFIPFSAEEINRIFYSTDANNTINIYGLIENDKIFYSTHKMFYTYDLVNNVIVSWWHMYMTEKMITEIEKYNIRPFNNNIDINFFPILYRYTLYSLETKTKYTYIHHQTGYEIEVDPETYEHLNYADRYITFYLVDSLNNVSINIGEVFIEARGYTHETKYCFFINPYDNN
jgi:hypothetical protein